VIRFWLELGLDGFRADAVPYLFEREGTSCENLPETHQFLKTMRRFVDENFPGRVLLAEANQWPEDVRPYFGESDEFQMNFHFPSCRASSWPCARKIVLPWWTFCSARRLFRLTASGSPSCATMTS